jgi:hypothetical protein
MFTRTPGSPVSEHGKRRRVRFVQSASAAPAKRRDGNVIPNSDEQHEVWLLDLPDSSEG